MTAPAFAALCRVIEFAPAPVVVRCGCGRTYTAAQFDALVSFAFNVGQTSFATSTLLKLLNHGDYASVPAQLGRFIFAGGRRLPGLVARRAAEGRLFSVGDYGLGV